VSVCSSNFGGGAGLKTAQAAKLMIAASKPTRTPV